MRIPPLAAAVICLALTSSSARAEVPPPEEPEHPFDAGAPVLAYNLAVVPLYTKRAPPYDDYTVLEEAQKAKALAVREVQDGEVARLSVRNKDKRPLYLLGGEVVLGGKQDRMISVDTVVDAGQQALVEVVCVEAGRWEGANLAFSSGDAVAHPELRRMAVFGGQQGVWSEVARKSAASEVSSPTGTYRRVLQDAKVRQRIARYLDEIQRQIPRDERLAGMAVAINGEIEVVDLFESPLLYSKLERKLLASYVLAAIEKQPGKADTKGGGDWQAKSKALKKNDVSRFIRGGTENAPGSVGDVSTKGAPTRGKVFKHKGKMVHGTWFGTEK